MKFEEHRTATKSHPLLDIGELAFNFISMEGFMNKILQSMAVLVLAFVGLAGCGFEPQQSGIRTSPWR